MDEEDDKTSKVKSLDKIDFEDAIQFEGEWLDDYILNLCILSAVNIGVGCEAHLISTYDSKVKEEDGSTTYKNVNFSIRIKKEDE